MRSKRNSKNRIPTTVPKDHKQTSSLSEDDLDALQGFIDQVEVDEMAFSDWRDLHSCLDLRVPFYLDKGRLEAGRKNLCALRQKPFERKKHKKKRLPVDREITWPKNSRESLVLTFPGEGDVNENDKGTLYIELRSKSQ